MSAFLLSLQLFFRSAPVQKLYARITRSDASKTTGDDLEASGSGEQQVSHVARHGGPVIFAFKVVRLLSTLTLLALSIAGAILNEGQDDLDFSFDSRWVAFGLIGTYVRLTSACTSAYAAMPPVDAYSLARPTRPYSRLSQLYLIFPSAQ